MNDDLPFTGFVILVLTMLGITFVVGSSIGSQNAERTTIKYCIEKPANCKIKYDYNKLEETK